MSLSGASLPTERMTSDEFLDGYFLTPSIHHHLIVDPVERLAIHHARGAGDAIRTSILRDGSVTLDPPGCSVDLDTFWEGLPT